MVVSSEIGMTLGLMAGFVLIAVSYSDMDVKIVMETGQAGYVMNRLSIGIRMDLHYW